MNIPPANLQAQCPYCGTAISVHQKIRPGHCDNPECHTRHAVKGNAIRQATLLSTYRDEVAQAKKAFQHSIDEQAAANGVAAERVHVGAVPHMDAPLIALPEERRLDFLTHLTEITEEAFALPVPKPEDIRRNYESERTEPYPWNTTACATCRGYCCLKGAETHAFIKVETITQLRHAQPDLAAGDVIALYMDALPEVSTEEGCVFQGTEGCTLERTQRADVCNTFRCYALHRLAEEIDPTAVDAVAIVSVEDKTPHRKAMVLKSPG